MTVGIPFRRARDAAAFLSGIALALAAIPSAALGQAIPMYAETPADSLARNVRTLADNPKNFTALVAAGKAALQLGDTQAAAGFFGRAQELNSASPLPPAGMGAALVATDDPNGALTYFARAQRLGANAAMLGCDRGLDPPFWPGACCIRGRPPDPCRGHLGLGERQHVPARDDLALCIGQLVDRAQAVQLRVKTMWPRTDRTAPFPPQT